MSTMNISLPDEMKNWVEDEVQKGGFSSASEFFHHLVIEAQVRQEAEARDLQLQALLIEGIESGEGEPVTAEWWTNLRAEMETELARRSGGS